MNIISLFDHSFIGKADKPALEFGDQTYTFGELDRRSNKVAHLLLAKGLTPGDRLCLYLENCVEFIDIYVACIKTGVIFVPVNILYKERELMHIYTDAQPKLFISRTDIPGDTIKCWLTDELLSEASSQPDTPVNSGHISGDTPAAIIYTSGTTGASKGAVLSNNNFMVNALNLITCWEITAGDRLLLGLPLFHVHGLANGLHTWLMAGYTLKLLERFEHQKAEAEFLGFRPTVFFGVPTMFIRMLDMDSVRAKAIGLFLRLVVSGSAPLPAHILEAFHEKYEHIILERYGMTETLMNISNPYIGERRAGTVGLPLPGVSAKIMIGDREAAVGEEGELHVKGGNVFLHYWMREEATQNAFTGGYFKTGDMAICSEDGYYTLKGRKSDLIISGGFNIYPREIEEYLMEQAGIAEAAVVGMPHELRGEVPVAYIVPEKLPFDCTAIETDCRKTFASFKIPKAFIIVDKLPRTALGKVQKHLLPKPV